MKRRKFITSLGAVSATSILIAAEPPPTVRTISTDVLVIGGGTAGTIAAIQAGRLGVRTLLVESSSQLGGTTTTGDVDFPGLFDAVAHSFYPIDLHFEGGVKPEAEIIR